MGSRDLSGNQQKIVKRYYEHLDSIALGRLGEIVGDLALAETDKARDRLWARAEKALGKVAANEVRVRKVLEERSVEGLAGLLTDLSGRG